jgi:manganese/zinc/iron transport system substrate-binding protein
MSRLRWMMVVCMIGPLVGGCAPGTSDEEQALTYPYRVVTTVGMINDLVREIGGERVEAVGLIGEGVDPHLYNPTRSDVAALMQADIIFYNGLQLEGKMTDVLIRVGRAGKPVYAVTDLIDPAYLMEHEELEGYSDPHVWMDVGAWMKALDVVAEALSEFDPAHAEEYRRRAESYSAELSALHEYARQVIATIPERNRILITAHDAFNYFGRAYDMEVRGIQGLSTESEAGLLDINRLVDLIVDREIGAVFVETSVAEKNVHALIEGARSRGQSVRIGGTLFSDAMGPSGTYEGTYIGMIDHNVTTIARALGGHAPEQGLHGRLSDL